jgi:hypothetical protein
MKTSAILVLVVLSLVCSCAAPKKYVWVCDKPETDKERALKECRYEVSKASASQPLLVPAGSWGTAMGASMMREGNLLSQCMDLRGCKYVEEKGAK